MNRYVARLIKAGIPLYLAFVMHLAASRWTSEVFDGPLEIIAYVIIKIGGTLFALLSWILVLIPGSVWLNDRVNFVQCYHEEIVCVTRMPVVYLIALIISAIIYWRLRPKESGG